MKVSPNQSTEKKQEFPKKKLYGVYTIYIIAVCVYFYCQSSSEYYLDNMLERNQYSEINSVFASPTRAAVISVSCSIASIVPSLLEFFMDWIYEPELLFKFYERVCLHVLVIIPSSFTLSYSGSPIQAFAFTCCCSIQLVGATVVVLSICNSKVLEIYGKYGTVSMLFLSMVFSYFTLLDYGCNQYGWTHIVVLIAGTLFATLLLVLVIAKLVVPVCHCFWADTSSNLEPELEIFW